jgi:hypothetical protein
VSPRRYWRVGSLACRSANTASAAGSHGSMTAMEFPGSLICSSSYGIQKVWRKNPRDIAPGPIC